MKKREKNKDDYRENMLNFQDAINVLEQQIANIKFKKDFELKEEMLEEIEAYKEGIEFFKERRKEV